MAPGKALEQLALQKRFLCAESATLRLVVASELQQALAPLRWMDRLPTRLRPLLWLGLPVAGFWFARRTKGPTRWVSAGLGAVRLLLTIRRFLGRSHARSDRSGSAVG